MTYIKNSEIKFAMEDMGIDKLPIKNNQLNCNPEISNPFTACMLLVEQAIDDVMFAHASWKSQSAAHVALMEINNEIDE